MSMQIKNQAKQKQTLLLKQTSNHTHIKPNYKPQSLQQLQLALQQPQQILSIVQLLCFNQYFSTKTTYIPKLQKLINLKILDLSRNSIKYLQNLDFIQKLQVLIVLQNQIQDLKQFSEGNYLNLRQLHLNRNKLNNLPLFKAYQLKYLNAFGNNIKQITQFTSQSYPKMTWLKLSCNQIKHIPLLKLPKLQKFDLQYNKIQQLNQYVFEQCFQLKQIHISHNKIIKTPKINSINLQILEINNNRLEDVNILSNHYYPNLNTLHIHSNNIKKLPKLNAPILQRIKINNNNLFFTDKYIKSNTNAYTLQTQIGISYFHKLIYKQHINKIKKINYNINYFIDNL